MNRPPVRRSRRMSGDELHARLVFVVALGLTITFVLAVATLLYGLLWVQQPLDAQSPNDSEAWKLLTPMVLFLTGALSGVLMTSGSKPKNRTDQSQGDIE